MDAALSGPNLLKPPIPPLLDYPRSWPIFTLSLLLLITDHSFYLFVSFLLDIFLADYYASRRIL